MLVTPKEIVVFRAKDGQVPFENWLDDLKDKRAVARVLARLARVRQGNLGDCKLVGEGGGRVACGFRAGLPGLFWAERPDVGSVALRDDKRTQERDIRLAKQYWQEFKVSES